MYVLQPPHRPTFCPDASLWTKMATYFTSIIGKQRAQIALRLLQVMPLWGKMQICDGGDIFRSTMASCKRGIQRDMSHVQVCDLMIGRFKFTLTHVNLVRRNHQDSMGTARGRCYRNLLWTAGTDPCLQLPTNPFLEELSGMTWLLALVTPCNTGGQDAIQELTT